jgi:hypothetical protein
MTWPEEVHALHEEASRRHFLDVWTREAILARLGPSRSTRRSSTSAAPPAICWKSSGMRIRLPV